MSIISDIEALRFLREPSYSKRVGSIVNALRDHTDIAKAQQKRIDELEAELHSARSLLALISSRRGKSVFNGMKINKVFVDEVIE